LVRAIPEPTVPGRFGNILEHAFERFLARPKLELAHPRMVANCSASRHGQQHAFVVVCRPRESAGRTPAVACRSSPSRRFAIVDFPAPEDPRSATVRPRPKTRKG
jgi:hypothetical protein